MRIVLALTIAVGIAIGIAAPGTKPRPAPMPSATPSPTTAPPAPAVTAGETVIARDPGGHFYASATVNDAPVRFVVDTGATDVALTQDDARRAHIDFDPAHFAPVGRGASGEVNGQFVTIDRIELDGRRVGPLRAVVLADLPVSLLGQSWLRQIGSVSITNDEMRLK